MQEGWGSGGDEVNLSTSQWEDEEGDMWNNTASQESNSSCSSWGNAPKKGLQKVGLKQLCYKYQQFNSQMVQAMILLSLLNNSNQLLLLQTSIFYYYMEGQIVVVWA